MSFIPEGWEYTPARLQSQGGQGSVVQVRRVNDGYVGAMKTLHPDHMLSRERRYRMQQEVGLLNLLKGDGVPNVLASNVSDWDTTQPLYVIVEWIDGPTLAEFCNGKPKSIDTALLTLKGLLSTIQRCHAAGVLHRDIKPDNIIMRNDDASDPMLIDFGMGWAAPASLENDLPEFETGIGQELGNRFLRLPEYAPGHHIRDTRSDVTMLVAILFFSLTGRAPRVLFDSGGKMPQEAMLDSFPEETKGDARWEGLRRIFQVGFQQRIDLRYSDTEQLAAALDALPLSKDVSGSSLADALKRINAINESADGEFLRQCQEIVLQAVRDFGREFHSKIHALGYEAGGQGAVLTEWVRAAKTTLLLSRVGASEPKVGFVYQVSFENGQYEASYSLIGNAVWHSIYKGPLADAETLYERSVGSVESVLARVLERYAEVLSGHVVRSRLPGI